MSAKKSKIHAPRIPTPQAAQLPFSIIDVGDQQIRDEDDYDHITELMVSIHEHGLLQPIVVQPAGNGRYVLVAGKHRLEACKRLKWETIPATIRPADQHHVKELALIENVIRKDISTDEEVRVVEWMYHDQAKSPSQIADALSRSRGWVDRRLAAATLPDDIKSLLFSGELSWAVAEKLATIQDEGFRKQITHATLEGRWAVHDIERVVDATTDSERDPAKAFHELDTAKNEHAPGPQTRACDGCQEAKRLDELGVIWCCAACRDAYHATMAELATMHAAGGE